MHGANSNWDYRDPSWVGKRLGLDKNTVYKFLQDGTIPAIQLGRKWLVSESRLLHWLEEEMGRQTRHRRGSGPAKEQESGRRLDRQSRSLLRRACVEARRHGQRHVGQEHLLMAIINHPNDPVVPLFESLELDAAALREALQRRWPAETHATSSVAGARKIHMKRALRLGSAEAVAAGQDLARGMHLLLGIILSGGPGCALFRDVGLEPQTIADRMRRLLAGPQSRESGNAVHN